MYRVPYILHKMDRASPDKCWWCNAERDTIFHIFWSCPTLKPFWEEVTTTIKHLTSLELKGNPTTCLLHLTERSLRKYKKMLTMRLLSAAKACVPALWRQSQPPTRVLWYSTINCILRMEELTATLHNTEEQF